MSLPKFPWGVETIATTQRVVDADGNDVVLVGNVHDPKVRELAAFIVQAANGYENQHPANPAKED